MRMPDVFTVAKRSAVMGKIRGRGNRDTEVRLAHLMRASGVCGWRRHIRLSLDAKRHSGTLAGRYTTPDFVFRKERVVVFVDGCFWHGCWRHANVPATRREFWVNKLSKNVARDRAARSKLRRRGWIVVRIWEHELVDRPQTALRKVAQALERSALAQ
ncbi:MAG: mismatch repair protein Vsr [Gemmatimonadetes bacterium]|nr:mismatch repair protein Vsr [Gemmatimonadota bacterium]